LPELTALGVLPDVLDLTDLRATGCPDGDGWVQHGPMTQTSLPRTPTDAGQRPGLPVRVARDLLTVRRVFGEPITTDGVTLVPVARVLGGSGYGDGDGEWKKMGQDEEGTGSGSGGGFGVGVSPVGVYVVRGSDVTWRPAMDLSRVILGGQVVGAIALLVLARIIRRRRR